MLSKSAARAFFVGGTAVTVLAFLGLTFDTFAKVPELTHSKNLTPEVVRGKDLWDSSNCMGCHTLFGEGGYYAPELTRVVERRGPEFIKAMLRDPEAMYPGQRKMKNYHFTPSQIDDLLAFFVWAGNVELQGFPPKPQLMPVAPPPANGGSAGAGSGLARTTDRPQVFNQLCLACHALDGQGGSVGPALDFIGDRRDADFVKAWLKDPAGVKSDTKMPKLPLTDGQITELTAFLSQLKKAPQP